MGRRAGGVLGAPFRVFGFGFRGVVGRGAVLGMVETGDVITVNYGEKYPDNQLKFPKFVRIRTDQSWQDLKNK